jgi:hypothetical protein
MYYIIAIASLVIYGSRKKEKVQTNIVVVDMELSSCEQNSIWPVTV